MPWPPSFQSPNVRLPRWNSPVQNTWSIGVSVVSCRPAAATTILKTEPGAYWLCTVRFSIGWAGLRINCTQASRSIVPVN